VSLFDVFGALGRDSNGRVDEMSLRSSRPPLFVAVKGNTPPRFFKFRRFELPPAVSLSPDFEVGRDFEDGGFIFSLPLFGF
jgi:hypothetical protein